MLKFSRLGQLNRSVRVLQQKCFVIKEIIKRIIFCSPFVDINLKPFGVL